MRAEDVPEIASLHMDLFPDYLLSRLGRRFLMRFYEWHVSRDGVLTTVFTDDSGVARGFIVGGATKTEYYRMVLRDLWTHFALQMLRYSLRNPAMVARTVFHRAYLIVRLPQRCPNRARRSTPVATLGATPEGFLAYIGLAELMRGTGAAAAMLAAFEQTAWNAGYRALTLGVRRDNREARRFYEKNHWLESGTEADLVTYHKILHCGSATASTP